MLPFSSLLIANRGEIACRIARTARNMGLRTIAVYSDADANACHVRSCDAAIGIGGRTPAESYLDVGDRPCFANGGWWRPCIHRWPCLPGKRAPLVVTGRVVARLRRRLQRRASALRLWIAAHSRSSTASRNWKPFSMTCPRTSFLRQLNDA